MSEESTRHEGFKNSPLSEQIPVTGAEPADSTGCSTELQRSDTTTTRYLKRIAAAAIRYTKWRELHGRHARLVDKRSKTLIEDMAILEQCWIRSQRAYRKLLELVEDKP